ncbi:ATP-binding cassette domain-containing protein [Cellulomonas xylanilytica]|uniref:ABC transporter n=1 Tax=Cellulomonas xylanilytica TaxID=233583 RepID=A0A510V1J6_9CELL|nr:ATP-binding cassette domain-containing protein [Cellulomonas xylanilytica]GEK20729.1 ABC transporter [Cellulomonas xylanilytica]
MIHARGLARTYKTRRGDVDAVRGVDLGVDAGEIVGFLGPNGAGKTTTLRMLTTLLRPTRGEATVAGADLRRDPGTVRRRIGYVAQSGSTSGEARAGEEVVDHALLYGVDRATATTRGRTLFEQLELDGLWDRKCSSLSGGQRRRLDIVTGLIHTPRLVFLDEPTTGLDPQARANLWTHVRGLRDERGSTVFLTTHYLDEADALCDRILVIDHGQIVAQGSPEDLKQRVSGDAVLLSAAQTADVPRIAAIAAQLSGADAPTVDGTLVEVRVPAGRTLLAGLLRSLDAEGIELDGVELRRPTLDDVFLTLTGRSLRDGESRQVPTDGAAA